MARGPNKIPSKATQVAAVGATAAVAARAAAAPSFSDLAATFGKEGLRYDAAGKVNGYKYPTPKDDTDRVRINNAVHEMWNPQRKIAVQMGGEHNAQVPSETLLDRKSGKRQVVPQHVAENKAKKAGLVAAPHWKGRRVMIADANGRLWKRGAGDDWTEA